MVFSTKADLVAHRPISEKMLINSWKYRDSFEKSIAAMSKVGFKYVNIGTWFNLTKCDGDPVFDNEIEKTQVALDICKKYGMKPMLNFGGQNNGYLNTKTWCNFNQNQLEKIKQYFSKFVQTFSNQGIIWANLNEPDNVYWAPFNQRHNPRVISSWVNFSKWFIDETFKFDKEALNAPYSCITSVADEGSDITRQAIQQGLFRRALGGISHPYVFQNHNNGQPEIMLELHEGTVAGLPLVSNEYGYPRANLTGDHDQGYFSMAEAAKYTARQTIIQDYLGFSIIGIYCDLGNSYSIENDDGSLNLVGKMTMDLVDELNGYTIQEKIEVESHDNVYDDIYIFRYSKKGFVDKIVYWAPEKVGLRQLSVNNKIIKLNITDYPQVVDYDGVPNPKEYFMPIKSNTSLGTEVVY